MDRQIVYPAQVALDTDLLNAQKDVLLGLGFLALDVIGSSTVAAGLGCTQTATPSLGVLIAPGRLYSLQNVDNTAYGSLAADTAHQIVKQGISLGAVTLPIAAPTVTGQSINYLIEATYSDVDTTNVVLPYYNVANPAQTYTGPNNSTNPQATQRQGQIILMAKPGTAATTGTQTTPAPDASYVGLFVVTIAFGATTVVNSNISTYSTAAFLSPVNAVSGSFTLTATGMSGTVTGTCYWRQVGPLVTLQLPVLTGTSNATTFTATGLPTALQPTSFSGITNQTMPLGLAENNTAYVGAAYAVIASGSGTISFGLSGSLAGWTASGTKAAAGNLSYILS